MTYTNPAGAGGGSGNWQSFDLEQDDGRPDAVDGHAHDDLDPGRRHFVVQAVNGVGKVTMDDNLGAFYRPVRSPARSSRVRLRRLRRP